MENSCTFASLFEAEFQGHSCNAVGSRSIKVVGKEKAVTYLRSIRRRRSNCWPPSRKSLSQLSSSTTFYLAFQITARERSLAEMLRFNLILVSTNGHFSCLGKILTHKIEITWNYYACQSAVLSFCLRKGLGNFLAIKRFPINFWQ